VAVTAGLQLLAVNGWQAGPDVPRAAALTIEDLASGQLTPACAALPDHFSGYSPGHLGCNIPAEVTGKA
jgi:hypothetical protein